MISRPAREIRNGIAIASAIKHAEPFDQQAERTTVVAALGELTSGYKLNRRGVTSFTYRVFGAS